MFYDVLLCAVHNTCAGVHLHIQVPDMGEGKLVQATWLVAGQWYVAIGYIDDSIFFAWSQSSLQWLVNLVDKFNHLACVKANAAKGFVLAFNTSEGGQGTVTLQGVAVPRAGPNDAKRYLRVFINSSGPRHVMETAVKRVVMDLLCMLRTKHVPACIVVYMINSVIIPSTVYHAFG